jgi:hypothetical protein
LEAWTFYPVEHYRLKLTLISRDNCYLPDIMRSGREPQRPLDVPNKTRRDSIYYRLHCERIFKMDRISASVLIAISLLVVLIIGTTGGLGVGIQYKRDALKAAADLATSLFVVALFFERALAVINDLLFGNEQQIADEAFFANGDGTKVAVVTSKKEMTRLAVGFLFGLLVSGAGPRTLEALLELPPGTGLSDSHRALFYGVDIVLTAGLLAGGSNGLAIIIDVIKKRTQSFYWHLMEERRANARGSKTAHGGSTGAIRFFDFTTIPNSYPLPLRTGDFEFDVTSTSAARVTTDGIHCGNNAVLRLWRPTNTIELTVLNRAQATITAWYLTNGGLQPSAGKVLAAGKQRVKFDLEDIVLITFDSTELFLHTVR